MFEDGKCPMTKEVLDEHPLTAKQQQEFCKLGCSIECGKLLKERINKLEKRSSRRHKK